MPRSKKATTKAETSVEKEIAAETVVEAAPAEAKKPAAKKTATKKPAAKKPAAKKAAIESKVVIQANGSEATAEDLVNKSIAAAGVKTEEGENRIMDGEFPGGFCTGDHRQWLRGADWR